MTNPFDFDDFQETDFAEVKTVKEPDYLKGLNPEQYEAVTTTEGPLLVLSGAGTGKTRVLTTRLAYIIDRRLAMPWQCLAVTFTNKASKEMSERLEKMIGADALSVWLGTFHKLGLRMLRQHYDIVDLQKDFVILGTDDSERICKQLMQADGVDIKQWTPAGLNAVIQRWKDRGLSPSSVSTKENSSFLNGGALSYYHRYQARLKELNAVDFGDLLLLPLEIFKIRPDIAAKYQKQFKYILVDEYQDTNVAQYLWLRLLAQGSGNLCCVGDDDQSIYSWRGAEVENILRFPKDFPTAKTIRLERNYRSTTHILGAASALIANNETRLGKTLYVAPERDGSGDRVQIKGYYSGSEEAERVIDTVENLMRTTPLSQMAVLVRAGFQTRAFEESLIKAGIPYQVIGDFKFYEREEIKDAVAYLRLLANPSDDLAFMRIVNKPRRGLGDATLQKLSDTARQKQIPLLEAIDWAELKPAVRSTLTEFKKNIIRWRSRLENGEELSEVTEKLLEESGYYTMWRMDKSAEAPGRLENLKELINVMSGEFQDLNMFIEHASLVMDTENQVEQELFTVMTLHASKGLEFDVVFLPGWEEELFPHAKSMGEGALALEEERRLAYVGLTRARKKAYISFAANRRVYGKWQNAQPSRFIDELPDEHIEMVSTFNSRYFDYTPKFSTKPSYQKWEENEDENLNASFYQWGKTSGSIYHDDESVVKRSSQKGKRVYHEKFGFGTVWGQDGEKLDIAFDKHGRKKIMARFVSET
ncbi:MAG: DNA helicase II [Alphaproteobacteria bacterium]|nr:DNA helicase II [Alphaproteobacteria bacterium]